jgi:anaerobic selenocysteine-containing dehydrogenase
VLSIHPEDAKRRRISQGDSVRIASAEGSTRARAHLEDSILPGVVSLPEGAWPDPEAPAEDDCGAANRVTSTLGTEADTSCIMHGIAVRVERVSELD